jgi:ribosomal protein L11 methyltransferase
MKGPKSLYELSIEYTRKELDPGFEEYLEISSHQPVIEEIPGRPAKIKFFLHSRKQALALKNEIRHIFLPEIRFTLHRLPHAYWATRWKKGLKVIRISNRLVICPSWIKYKKKTHEKVIWVDPGMAFGTGHHATTRMCLEWLEPRAKSWKNICDVGCGSGILAISAVKLGTKKAVGIDIDTEAIAAAEENARLNRVSDKTFWFTKDISKKKISQKFDCVLANLTARDIEKNWAALVKRVKGQGLLILAGIEDSQTHWFNPWILKKKGFEIEDKKIEGDWHGYFLRRNHKR